MDVLFPSACPRRPGYEPSGLPGEEIIEKIGLLGREIKLQSRFFHQLAQLPVGPGLAHFRDPFDRLIIAQAMTENLPIITDDSFFRQYAVNIIW